MVRSVSQNLAPLLALTQFMEQGSIDSSFDSSLRCDIWQSSTANGFGMGALSCPSDGKSNGLRFPGA
jgi:hypothetical protein